MHTQPITPPAPPAINGNGHYKNGNGYNGNGHNGVIQQVQKLTPHSIEAEEAVIGSLIIDTHLIRTISRILEPDDFYLVKHHLIYSAIFELYQNHIPADLVAITDQLEANETLHEIGGAATLTDYISITPTSIHADHYSKIVIKYSLQRLLIDYSALIAKLAYSKSADLIELITTAETKLKDIKKRLTSAEGREMDLKAAADYQLYLLEQRQNPATKPDNLTLPWADLSKKIPYIPEGTFVGIMATPGGGKTTFKLNLAEYWAKAGYNVDFYYYELSEEEITNRRMCRLTGIDKEKIVNPDLMTEQEMDTYIRVSNQMPNWAGNLTWIKATGWTMPQLIAHAEKRFETNGTQIIMVDYFNKVRRTGRKGLNSAQDREEDLEDFTEFLNQTGSRGFMSAQFDKLSRKDTKNSGLDGAKDTSALEDKANLGIIIDREKDENGELMPLANIRIAKQNSGAMGSVPLYFKGSHYIFIPVALKTQPLDY